MSRRIAILGFAPSRTEAPFDELSWDIWGVNDVYAHVKRVDATFEIHHLQNLGNRRNPKYEEWMRAGCPSGTKASTPIYMVEPRAEWPSSQRFPFEAVRMFYNARHDTDYFTSSIAWLLALAICELTEDVSFTRPDGSEGTIRMAKPGCEIGMWGVDMAHDTEYAGQRPAVEYYAGMARGMGLSLYIPKTSDICKTTAVYGIGTTSPLAIKARMMIEKASQTKQEILGQIQAQQNAAQMLQYQLGCADGTKDTWKYIERVWTQQTDVETGAVLESKDRGLPMPGSPLALEPLSPVQAVPVSDGQPAGVV